MDAAVHSCMSKIKVTLIDYGMGNIWSVLSALKYLDCDVIVSSDPVVVEEAETLLLPGVGSFRKAMESLRDLHLDEAIMESVQREGNKILGICLGMQLLGNKSSEDGETIGLNLIPTPVEEFSMKDVGANKIPHIGFDQVSSQSGSRLFQGLPENPDFYFVHSYRMLPFGLNGKSAICRYGIDFLAAYENDNVFATQFHPEKSQTNGLMLLKNFLAA
jgi:glutamine amidotransferase